jgi:hypothetical protein
MRLVNILTGEESGVRGEHENPLLPFTPHSLLLTKRHKRGLKVELSVV